MHPFSTEKSSKPHRFPPFPHRWNRIFCMFVTRGKGAKTVGQGLLGFLTGDEGPQLFGRFAMHDACSAYLSAISTYCVNIDLFACCFFIYWCSFLSLSLSLSLFLSFLYFPSIYLSIYRSFFLNLSEQSESIWIDLNLSFFLLSSKSWSCSI